MTTDTPKAPMGARPITPLAAFGECLAIIDCAEPSARKTILAALGSYKLDDIEPFHNCDEMGCGSAGLHIIAIVRLWRSEDPS